MLAEGGAGRGGVERIASARAAGRQQALRSPRICQACRTWPLVVHERQVGRLARQAFQWQVAEGAAIGVAAVDGQVQVGLRAVARAILRVDRVVQGLVAVDEREVGLHAEARQPAGQLIEVLLVRHFETARIALRAADTQSNAIKLLKL